MRNHLQVMKGILFLALAPIFALLSFESLSELWGHQDSPSWIYILYGSISGLLTILCLTLSARAFRRH
jgi:hypothetical protein